MSDSDKQALLDGTATIPFRITILGETEDDNVVLTESDIVNITYEDYRYVDTATICIGQFVARDISGTVLNSNSDLAIENKEIKVEMGVKTNSTTTYYSLGNFLITAPENNDVTGTTDFEAMDYTKKFNQEFDATGLTFPCTALQLAQYCCNKCGVELATTTFTNSTFIVPNNQYETGDTYRKVMQDIGKLAYSWIRIGWDNKCYIDFSVPSTTIEDDNKITPHNYYDLTVQNEKFGPVNRVVIGMSDVEGENAYVEDGDSIAANGVCELQIMDCNITYTPELRQQAITGASRLFGLTFLPIEINTTGHPWLLGNELIEIEKTDGTKITTIPFDRTIEYAGHIKTKLVASADTKTETEYKNPGTLETAVKQTRITVDKQNQTITQVVENVSQYDERITQVEQDVDSISQQVSQITDLTREVTNTSSISTGEDATTGYPVEFRIYGDVMPIYPSNDLYPSDKLFPKPSKYYLTIEYTEEDETKQDVIQLPFDYLTYLDDTYDEFVIDGEGNASKIKRIGFSSTGQKYVLPEEQIISYGQILIQLHEGINTLSLNYYTPTFYLKYAVKSDLTDVFATKVELNTSITQTTDSIMLEVNKKVDDEEFGTMITQNVDSVQVAWNQIGENVKIEADEGQAELNIYDEDSNLLMSLNKSGQEFYRDTKNIGSIGLRTIQVENDNGAIDNYYGIVNYINSVSDNNGDGSFIEWTEQLTNETGTDVSGTILGFYGTNFLTGQDKRIVSNYEFYAPVLHTINIAPSTNSQYATINIIDGTQNPIVSFGTGECTFYKNVTIPINYSGGTTNGFAIATSLQDNVISSSSGSYRITWIYAQKTSNEYAYVNFVGPSYSTTIPDGDTLDRRFDAIAASDKMLKSNIKDSNKKALNDISKIKIREFDWNNTNRHDSIGLIAQELEDIDETYTYDDIKITKNGEENITKSLNLKSLIALAIKGLQEQQEEIEDLKNQIKELKENGKN